MIYHDLEIWVRGHSKLFKPVPFESLGAVSYLSSIVTMALYLASVPRYSEILVENRDFFIPPCIRRPRYGDIRRNIFIPFGAEN